VNKITNFQTFEIIIKKKVKLKKKPSKILHKSANIRIQHFGERKTNKGIDTNLEYLIKKRD